jgi:PKHD-type hydroxylase
MILVIDSILDRHEVAALHEAASALPFADGRATTGRYARDLKRNEQATDTPARAAIVEKVRLTLEANTLVRAAAHPRQFARIAV